MPSSKEPPFTSRTVGTLWQRPSKWVVQCLLGSLSFTNSHRSPVLGRDKWIESAPGCLHARGRAVHGAATGGKLLKLTLPSSTASLARIFATNVRSFNWLLYLSLTHHTMLLLSGPSAVALWLILAISVLKPNQLLLCIWNFSLISNNKKYPLRVLSSPSRRVVKEDHQFIERKNSHQHFSY